MTSRKRRRKNSPRPGQGELLTEKELAKRLGEKERTVMSWRYRGIIPYLSLGHRSVRYRLDHVLSALDKREAGKRRRVFYEQPL